MEGVQKAPRLSPRFQQVQRNLPGQVVPVRLLEQGVLVFPGNGPFLHQDVQQPLDLGGRRIAQGFSDARQDLREEIHRGGIGRGPEDRSGCLTPSE